ncbi:Winged helix-turn-helix transcription repressor DNA-binding [Penicillium waksmanii]|uniref:Winged helix-turn-helix transcription repressor DNA-binding n=1 Tax=Penicillium waksmanii TaxID=69791 RepID=UPI00254699FC|nr:Winged helix-turn-helix transcription repressor DNA-binding [Penicillium waksmanii]KAJ5976056.1 Winged helix-turn-helix transcription repressor DNA-binding [Penicillium waksmanii]
MDGSAPMAYHDISGETSNQGGNISQVAQNDVLFTTGTKQTMPDRFEASEPPVKRLRTSDGPLTQTHQSFPVEEQTQAASSSALPPPPGLTGPCKNGNIQGDIYGNSSTPNESTASMSLTSSYQTAKSTSPPTTPGQSTSTPTHTAGVSILESNKVDLSKCRPRSSIPSRLAPSIYAQQCVAAAYASRLDPYALHRKEQEALQDQLCHVHVTLYLNIRNGILRLWTVNPMVSITREEAIGCAKDYRWMNLASFAYDWLSRKGYINFGCVEVPTPPVAPRRGRRKEGPTIVVIGGGVGGLGCARQLEGLFRHYRDADTAPRVIVLEGRRRIGGRVYSHPLRSLESDMLPPGLTPKAEMGAQIIVGFDHGNPLDQIVRGQLALHYHLLRDISTIYDIDGSPVHEVQDAMDEKLYNDVLDRTGVYRSKTLVSPTAEGDHDMIDNGRESLVDDGLNVRQYEEARAAGTIDSLVPTKRVRRRRGVGHKTADLQPNPDVVGDLMSPSKEHPAALTCQATGWTLNPGISPRETINLDPIASASQMQTLGTVMNEGVQQYQRMLPLTPKDLRLLNWHFANLEYANATNVDKLSLSGWDQDIGNEFEGEHSTVIGGYQQLPFGLYSLPTKLDLRTNKIVKKITYDATGSGKKTVVACEDGEKFAADHVVYSGSLGTLKHKAVEFDPPLPEWKTGAIDRLGFGVMNKVVLVFDEPFWDTERDMFGLLREPSNPESTVQEDYAANRGRFYLFWNCLKTTGLPVLIALMAGDAAHQAENTPDGEIITEVTGQLRNVFKNTVVPDPIETIITRWASDPFTRGSYSYVAAETLPQDYELMAQRIGNLYFAGEATCGTHPATVHGAYLSGLRAASEVIESVVGPIEVPTPLVPEKQNNTPNEPTATVVEPKSEPTTMTTPSRVSTDKQRRETYDQAMWTAIYAEIGAMPTRPAKAGLNPFLLYQKDYWAKCRDQCDETKRVSSKNPAAKAGRDEIRHALGQMWRNAAPEEKRPYLEQVEANRRNNDESWDSWKAVALEWERRSYEVKDQWCAANPFEQWETPS